jgi:tetratricopeptide (TPR) repeat protein
MAWTQIERLVVFREKHKEVLRRLAKDLSANAWALQEIAAGVIEFQPDADRTSLVESFENYLAGFYDQWPAQETPDRLLAFGRSLAAQGISRSGVAGGLNRLRRSFLTALAAATLEDDSFLEAFAAITMAEDLILTGCRKPLESGEVEAVVAPDAIDMPRLIQYVSMLSNLREAQDALSQVQVESARQKLQAVIDLKPHDPGVIRQIKWLTQCADAIDAEARLVEVRRLAELGDPAAALELAKTRPGVDKHHASTPMLVAEGQTDDAMVTELHAQAIIAMESGDYDTAQTNLDRASGYSTKAEITLELKARVKSLRKSADARILLDEAANHIANHRLDDARERLDKVRSIDPNNPRLAGMLKQVNARSDKPEAGLYEEAITALEKGDLELATRNQRALQAPDGDPVLAKSLKNKIDEVKRHKTIRLLQVEAERLILDGDYENAARKLLQARSMSPDRPDTNELIDKLAKLSRLRGAKQFFVDAQVAVDKGDYRSAESKLRQGLTIEPQNSDLIKLQAKVHQVLGVPKPEVEQLIAAGKRAFDNGNAQESFSILQQAHAIDPDNSEVNRLIREAKEKIGSGETVAFSSTQFHAEAMSGVMRVGPVDDKEPSSVAAVVLSFDPVDLVRDIEDARIQGRQLIPLPADFEYPLDDEDSAALKPSGSPDDSGIKTALPTKPKAKPPVPGGLYHWMVTSTLDVPKETQFRYAMDTHVDFGSLPITRDVLFLDPVFFGVFPQRGPHEMFYRHGGYTDWRSRLTEWLGLHENRMRKHLSKLLPATTKVDKLPRYGVLGRLGWQASHETTANTPSDKLSALANDTDYHDDWEEFVRTVNKRWDKDFLDAIQTEIPDKTDGFDDLNVGGQRRRFARKKILADAWDYFAKVLFLFTLKTCKSLYPTIQWGFMGYPANLSISDPTDVRAKMIYHQGMNDRMDWLWKNVDIIVPRYPTRHISVPEGVKPSEAARQNAASQDIKAVEYNMGEALRIRNTFAPDRRVFPANSYTYAGVKGQTLNDINMEHNFRLPLLLGVDGVFIVGQIDTPQERDQIQHEVSGKLGAVIKRAVEQTKRLRNRPPE